MSNLVDRKSIRCPDCGVDVSRRGRCCRSCGNKRAAQNPVLRVARSISAKRLLQNAAIKEGLHRAASIANVNRWKDPFKRKELCCKLSEAAKRRWLSIEEREKQSNRLKKPKANFNCIACRKKRLTKDALFCRTCSAIKARKTRWKNPLARQIASVNSRARHLAGNGGGWAVVAKKLWSDPEHRRKMSETGTRNLKLWHRFTYIDRVERVWRMRSSWEVQFAYWLDSITVEWQYEPVALSLQDDCKYTPDFWVDDWKEFIEIKGPIYSKRKAEMAIQEGYPVRLVCGSSVLHDKHWIPAKALSPLKMWSFDNLGLLQRAS